LGFVIHPRLEIFESGCGTWKRRDENQSSIVATIGIASRREKMFSFLFVSCSMLLTCGFEKVIGMVDKVFDKRFCLAFALAWHRLGMSRASYGAQVAALRQFDAARKGTVREHLMIFFFFSSFKKVLFSNVVLMCAELAISSVDVAERDSYAKDALEAAKQVLGGNEFCLLFFCLFVLKRNADLNVFLVERAVRLLRQHGLASNEDEGGKQQKLT